MFRHPPRCSGFTLIEISIVLVIAGLVMSALLSTATIYFHDKTLRETRDNMAAAKTALRAFVAMNGYYPCPASRAAARGMQGFGKAPESCATIDPDGSVTTAQGRDKLPVKIGILPFRSLGLADDQAVDGWGNVLQYAVTESLTSADTYDQREGAIDVVAEDNVSRLSPPGTAQYVVFSTGQNGRGAYSGDVAAATPCSLYSLEGENCDGDAIFMEAQIQHGGNGVDYDDYIVYQQYDPLTNNKSGLIFSFYQSCPPGFTPVAMQATQATGIENIYKSSKPDPGDTGGTENRAICFSDRYSATIMMQVSSSAKCPLGWSNIGYKIFGTGESAVSYKICAR